MKKIVYVLLIVIVFTCSAYAAGRVTMESQIMEWSKEKVAEFEKNGRKGPAAEWNAHIQDNDYEWLAVNLIVHYSLDKQINMKLKENRKTTPKLDENIQRDKTRLVVLGEYISAINK